MSLWDRPTGRDPARNPLFDFELPPSRQGAPGTTPISASLNPFLTIHRAKIAGLKSSVVDRVKRGRPPWTPVRCLTFEPVALQPPRRRLGRVNGTRGGTQLPWSTSRRVRAPQAATP